MIALSVNLNKIALIRNSRDTSNPSVTEHAAMAIAAGADGITVHPRPDQRHIRADIPEQVWQTFTEASWSSRKAIAGLSPTEKVNRWQRTATKSQVAFVGRVLDSCELGSIYDADSVQEK